MSVSEGEVEVNDNTENGGGSDEDEDKEYEVERVLDQRSKRGKREFLVRWKNYGPEHDTWEPEANLHGAKDVLKQYLAMMKASGSKGAKGGNKRGSKDSVTPKNKVGRGNSNAPKPVDTEEDSDDDDENTAERADDSDEDDGEFEPTKTKKKKTMAGTSKDPRRGSKTGNKKRSGNKEADTSSGGRQRRSTSRRVEDSLVSKKKEGDIQKPEGPKMGKIVPFSIRQTKAVNLRISMNKGNANSWITSSEDDDSDIEKKNKELEGIKKNEAIIPELIVPNGPKEDEKMDEGGEGNVGKGKASKANENGESPPPPVDPSASQANDNVDLDRDLLDNESPVKLAETATSHSRRATRSGSVTSTSTIVANLSNTNSNYSGASTAIENGHNRGEEVGKEAGTSGTERNLRKRGATGAHENVPAVKQRNAKFKMPAELIFNSMFRTQANKLVAVANYGMPNACEVQINATTEKKIAEIVKEQLKKNGPWSKKTSDGGEDDEEEEDNEEEED